MSGSAIAGLPSRRVSGQVSPAIRAAGPKARAAVSTVIAAALSERVAVTENGQRRHISKLEAAVKQLVNRAASGEFRATQLLLALAQANESRSAQQDEQRFSEDDAVVMKELARRLKGDDE